MISPSYFTFFVVFAIIAYLIATDNSVAQYITLLSKIVVFQYQKTKWMILNDPRNPIVRYLIWRRSYVLARELQEEMERQSRVSNDNSKIAE